MNHFLNCLFAMTVGYSAIAQQHPSTVLMASRLNTSPKFDGLMDDPCWEQTEKITELIQREPSVGEMATEETWVAVAYDEKNLWIGLWCYQSDMSKVIAKSYQRDFDEDAEDNVQIVISPFNDHRNGYLFIINPLGARRDALVAGNEETNDDWNGVWDARTSRDEYGWYAEIQIPYNTLKFTKAQVQEWAFNVERNIKSRNEQVRWQGWSRDHNLANLAVAGQLLGIHDIQYSERFELKPYVLGGYQLNNEKGSIEPLGKTGADLNWNITPNLKLNLTVNTDFAQVESDKIQVNLTRFNLYYPEKREFFLEGDSYFNVNLGQTSRVFYTRRIGIENFEPVNVLGGVRLFGKEGANNIGFLSLQTASSGDIPTTNNTVFRYRRDIGTQSYVGGILTSKFNQDKHNLVFGVDGSYTTSQFFGDKNFVATGCLVASMDDGEWKGDNVGFRFMLDYPNELIDHYIAVASIPKNYNPELGFIGRHDYDALSWKMDYSPRVLGSWGIRKLQLQPWYLLVYRTHSTKVLETITMKSTPLGFLLKSGDSFEYSVDYNLDRLSEVFELSDEILIAPGEYQFFRHNFQVETFQGRRLWVELDFSTGQFYGGKMSGLESVLGVNVSKNLNLTGIYELNLLRFPESTSWVHQVAAYVNYAFNTRVDLSLFGQWNNESDEFLLNFRIHWIPKIGSDFYFVLNNGYEPMHQAELLRPQIHSGAAKLVWRIVF